MKELTKEEISKLNKECIEAVIFFDNDPNPRYVGDYVNTTAEQDKHRDILKDHGIMYFDGCLYWL